MHYLWACSQPWICTKVNTTSKEQRKLICTHHVALIVSVKEHNLCLKLPILPFFCLGSILSVKPVKLITAVLSLSQERENSLIRLFIVQYRLWPLEAIGVGCLPKFFFLLLQLLLFSALEVLSKCLSRLLFFAYRSKTTLKAEKKWFFFYFDAFELLFLNNMILTQV